MRGSKPRIGLAINENEIGADMAMAEVFPIPGERVRRGSQ
jgi:hypothetical protein